MRAWHRLWAAVRCPAGRGVAQIALIVILVGTALWSRSTVDSLLVRNSALSARAAVAAHAAQTNAGAVRTVAAHLADVCAQAGAALLSPEDAAACRLAAEGTLPDRLAVVRVARPGGVAPAEVSRARIRRAVDDYLRRFPPAAVDPAAVQAAVAAYLAAHPPTQGPPGPPGRGVASVVCSDGQWRVTYDDGSDGAAGACTSAAVAQPFTFTFDVDRTQIACTVTPGESQAVCESQVEGPGAVIPTAEPEPTPGGSGATPAGR